MKTFDRVYNLVKKIPKGKISTYGQIGQMIGLNPRVVGWALNRLAKDRKGLPWQAPTVPWQRVINSKGTISTNKLSNIPLDLQKRLLENEGIKFDKAGRTDLKKYIWKKKTK
jgi:methylated-DNA-protein-cysteine methyltransferase-like protein